MLRGFLDNDSLFGQIMLRCWAIIICNLCFVITVLPIVTAGAGWAAMDFALMNTLKNKDSAAPFRDFWKGFVTNFKQAAIIWICSLVLLAFLAMEWYWCRQFGGIFDYIKIGILMIAAVIVITLMYLFPTMAAFKVTYMDLQRLPLYAFLWTFFGFAAVSLITVNLLLAEYMPYLETKKEVKEGEAPEQSGQKHQKTEKEILDEMQKLGM